MKTEAIAKPNTRKAANYFKEKNEFTTGPVEVSILIQESPREINVVDVRAEEDYRQGHVPGAVNLPQEKWETFEGLDRDRTNIIYCYSITCHLASKAAALFASRGYPVMEMEGGFEDWDEHHLNIEK